MSSIASFFRSKHISIILVFLTLTTFYCSWDHLSKHTRKNPKVFFGSDHWMYHSLGVNLALGHGYQVGKTADFATYNYFIWPADTDNPALPLLYKRFMTAKYDFYTAPGYALFLALVYLMFGIANAIAVINIQIIFIAAVSAHFIPIGYLYGKKTGVVAGVIASMIFTRYLVPSPSAFMAEPLMIFSISIWVILFYLFQVKPSRIRLGALGLWSGWLMLVKGVVWFLPPLIILYILLREFSKKTKVVYIGIYIIGIFMLTMPWSIYASQKSGKFVFVETHGGRVLMDGNNEDTFKNGGWRPQWSDGGQAYFYNRLEGAQANPTRSVLLFWKENVRQLPLMFMNKLKSGFAYPFLPWFLIGMFGYFITGPVFFKPHPLMVTPFPWSYYILLINIVLITILTFGDWRFTFAISPFYMWPAIYLPFHLLKLLLIRISDRKVR